MVKEKIGFESSKAMMLAAEIGHLDDEETTGNEFKRVYCRIADDIGKSKISDVDKIVLYTDLTAAAKKQLR